MTNDRTPIEHFDKVAAEYDEQGDDDSARSVRMDKRVHEAFLKLEEAHASNKHPDEHGRLLEAVGRFLAAMHEHEDGPCPCSLDQLASVERRVLGAETVSTLS